MVDIFPKLVRWTESSHSILIILCFLRISRVDYILRTTLQRRGTLWKISSNTHYDFRGAGVGPRRGDSSKAILDRRGIRRHCSIAHHTLGILIEAPREHPDCRPYWFVFMMRRGKKGGSKKGKVCPLYWHLERELFIPPCLVFYCSIPNSFWAKFLVFFRCRRIFLFFAHLETLVYVYLFLTLIWHMSKSFCDV